MNGQDRDQGIPVQSVGLYVQIGCIIPESVVESPFLPSLEEVAETAAVPCLQITLSLFDVGIAFPLPEFLDAAYVIGTEEIVPGQDT